MANDKNYRYNVFGLTRGNKKSIEEYVAEGSLGSDKPPMTLPSKSGLINEIYHQHANGELFSMEYLSFSFEPTCEKVIYQGEIYSTQTLSENEQNSFLRNIRDFARDYIDEIE